MIIGTQKNGTRPNGNTYKDCCKNGHEFSIDNTYISPKSQKRTCRICNAARYQRELAANTDEIRRKNREHMREWRAANKDRDHKNWTELRKRKKEWLASQKTACACGESDPNCLDFHHKDPSQKDANLSVAIAHWGIERLQLEMEKCEIICSNCHRKLHAAERAAEKVS